MLIGQVSRRRLLNRSVKAAYLLHLLALTHYTNSSQATFGRFTVQLTGSWSSVSARESWAMRAAL